MWPRPLTVARHVGPSCCADCGPSNLKLNGSKLPSNRTRLEARAFLQVSVSTWSALTVFTGAFKKLSTRGHGCHSLLPHRHTHERSAPSSRHSINHTPFNQAPGVQNLRFAQPSSTPPPLVTAPLVASLHAAQYQGM